MKRFVLAAALLFAALPVFAAADLTGKWTGSFNPTGPDGQTQVDHVYMDLKQTGMEIKGQVGPDETKNWTILKGKIDGTKVNFDVDMKNPDGGQSAVISFTLTLVDDHLKGSAAVDINGQKMTAAVDVTRTK
jgi:hypothetical protein